MESGDVLSRVARGHALCLKGTNHPFQSHTGSIRSTQFALPLYDDLSQGLNCEYSHWILFMDELTHYAVSLAAFRNGLTSHCAEILRAEHYKDAGERAMMVCKERFSEAEGWSQWSVATEAFWIVHEPKAFTANRGKE